MHDYSCRPQSPLTCGSYICNRKNERSNMEQIPKKEPPHQANLRKGRFSVLNSAYHITKCALDRENANLNEESAANELIGALNWCVDHGHAKCGGFVIMKDHYHLIIAVVGVKKLDKIVASIDQYTATKINHMRGRKGKFWEPGFHDHAIRGYEDFLDILHYIHQNPVRKNLVESPELYLFSTFMNKV